MEGLELLKKRTPPNLLLFKPFQAVNSERTTMPKFRGKHLHFTFYLNPFLSQSEMRERKAAHPNFCQAVGISICPFSFRYARIAAFWDFAFCEVSVIAF